MQVSILTPDLSHNCLGRAYVLAQLIERNHDVEIIGPKLRNGIWTPLKDEYDYLGIDTNTRIDQFSQDVPNILNLISGDVIYASKPRLTSFGIGLLASVKNNIPLILDIDDWESGFRFGSRGKVRTYLRGVRHLHHTKSFYYTRFLEGLSEIPDFRTVSNTFLQNRFGGTIIPHARDTGKFYPARFDRHTVRKEFDLPSDAFLVMFAGTPRPHKGLDDLAQAVAGIKQDDIRVLIVGARGSEYINMVREINGKSLIIRGLQPFHELPKWLSAADVIAIPQKHNQKTRGQTPAKVFDAMAMGKPIIATDVGDLSMILDNCGIIIEPENHKQLRESILTLYNNESLRNELGNSARRRCLQKYSYDAVAPVINNIISDVS